MVHTSTDFGIGGAWLAEYTLTALGAGIVLFDAAGHATQWSSVAPGLLGLDDETLAGRALHDPALAAVWTDRRPLDDQDDPVQTVLRTGEPLVDVVIGVPDPAARAADATTPPTGPRRDAPTVDAAERSPARRHARARAASERETALRWRSLCLLPVFGVDHRPRAVLASVVDVTDAVDVRGVVARWQLMARSLLADAITATVVVDRSGTIVEWNPRAVELVDRGEADLIGCPLADLCDIDVEWIWEQVRQAPNGIVEGTTWAVRRLGPEVEVFGRFSLADWPDLGEVVVAQLLDPSGYVEDGAVRRAAVGTGVFEHAVLPMLLITEYGMIVDANHRAAGLLGCGRPDMTGGLALQHLHGLTWERLRSRIAEAKANVTTVEVGTFTARGDDGATIEVAAYVSPLCDDGPSPLLLLQLVDGTRTVGCVERAPEDHQV
jgi:PAS domain S-box-containing protein